MEGDAANTARSVSSRLNNFNDISCLPSSLPGGVADLVLVRRLHRPVMKLAVFGFLCLLSIAATGAVYGWLESTVNMIEGLGLLFAPGATTVVFAPFLLLFIVLGLAVFVATPMLATAIAAAFGGLLLRSLALRVSRSFVRSFVFVAIFCHIAFIVLATRHNAPFLLGRPREHPKTPDYALACLAGANAALNSLVAALIIRRLTTKAKPPLWP